MSFADVNGQRIYFEDHGGDGPAVLFSHGFLMDHEMFAPQVEALHDVARVVTWDQRGHGSTPAAGPFSYWDSADDALALLTYLGLARATFAGMSQGGFVSLRAALRDPERVASLVLIDTQAGTEDPSVAAAYDAMHAEWVANGPGAVREAVASVILGPGADTSPWFAKWEVLTRESLAFPYRCLMDRDDVTPRLGEISAPAIVFHGSDDAAIPMERAEILCQGLPGCRDVVVVEGGGHASNLTHADQVNPLLRRFVSGLCSRRHPPADRPSQRRRRATCSMKVE